MGYAEGLQSGSEVGQRIFNNLDPIRRQSALEQLQAQRQANALNEIKLQRESTTYAHMLGAQQAAQSVQDVPEQTVTTNNHMIGVGTNPNAINDLILGERGGPRDIGTTPTLPSGNVELQKAYGRTVDNLTEAAKDFPVDPGIIDRTKVMANDVAASNENYNPAKKYGPDGTAPYDINNPNSSQAQGTQYPATQTTTTPAKPANRMAAYLDYLKNNDMELYNQEVGKVTEQAAKLIAVTGNAADGVNLYNSMTGNKITASKSGKYDIIKDGDGNVNAIMMHSVIDAQLAAGASPQEAVKAGTVPMNPNEPVGNKLSQFMHDTPGFSYQDLTKFIGENHISVTAKGVSSILESARKSDEDAARDDRYNKSQERIAADSARTQANSDRNFNLAMEKMTAGNGNPEDRTIIATMLANGDMNISDLSRVKDKVSIIAEAKRINPNYNPQFTAAENKAFTSTITAQEKQFGMMGSFVKNMSYQVDRVKEISKELESYDTRILNVPLRAARGRIAGSPAQAKYDMYITEIENEIGKLATGSAASISELSVGAQQKWEKIHDKNLSIKDMISLLEETKKAGLARMDSVKSQIADTKSRQLNMRGGNTPPAMVGNKSIAATPTAYVFNAKTGQLEPK